MKTARVLRALGPIDAKSITRDPMLRWIVFFPLLVIGMIRWGTPIATSRLLRLLDFDLEPYYLLLMSFVPIMTPMMAGMVIGFLLLDQRDDGTLSALQVTPLTGSGYLLYRCSVPMLLSVAVTILIFPLAGLVQLGWPSILASSLSGAPLAPLYALSLAGLARNKVEGFALTKAMGVLLLAPILAWLVPIPWQWILGLVPLYWPAKVLWLLAEGRPSGWVYLVVGILYQWWLLAVLMRRYIRSIHT